MDTTNVVSSSNDTHWKLECRNTRVSFSLEFRVKSTSKALMRRLDPDSSWRARAEISGINVQRLNIRHGPGTCMAYWEDARPRRHSTVVTHFR